MSSWIQEVVDDAAVTEAGAYACVEIVVSDLHISAGPKLEVIKRKSLFGWLADLLSRRRRERRKLELIDNPLEDFRDDDVFASFARKIAERYAAVPVVRLLLLGDIFDPMAVTWNGDLDHEPFEEIAVGKMSRIIAGHPVFFDALASLVRQPNFVLEFYAGNHDVCLAWPSVKNLLIARLCGDDVKLAAKISFVDHEVGFRVRRGPVFYYHGNDAEPHNELPKKPEDMILTHRIGDLLPLKKPILNEPFGNYMACGLAYRLKLYNEHIGRVRNERDLWIDAAAHRWAWGLHAGVILVWQVIHNMFFAFWDIRRKTSFAMVFKMLLATLKKNPVDEYALKILKKEEDVRVVIMAHSHQPRRVTGPDGTYINVGSWMMKRKFVWPTYTHRWKRFRWLETIVRTTVHFFRTGELHFARKLTRAAAYVTLIALLTVFLMTTFPMSAPTELSFDPNDLKAYAGILLAFLVLSGLFRFFSAEPEIVPDTKYSFALVCHSLDGRINAELMEYFSKDDSIHEFV